MSQPHIIRRRRKTGAVCLYIPKGTHRDLTEGERMMCIEEFNRWLDGRELHQALADEAAERRRSLPVTEDQLMAEAERRQDRAVINAQWMAAINQRQPAEVTHG
jgi:hypothetical protein